MAYMHVSMMRGIEPWVQLRSNTCDRQDLIDSAAIKDAGLEVVSQGLQTQRKCAIGSEELYNEHHSLEVQPCLQGVTHSGLLSKEGILPKHLQCCKQE